MQVEIQYNKDRSEENKKLLDDAIATEQSAIDARDAAQLNYENKKLEYIYNGLDKQLKAIDNAKKAEISAIKERIDHYKKLIEEMDAYGRKAEELQYDIMKAVIENNKRLEEERPKMIPTEALQEYQQEVDKGLAAINKKSKQSIVTGKHLTIS